jgi:hypothetical protein
MKQNLVKNSKGQYNYQFLFIGGGFNDVWASNKTEAIKLANQKFPSFKVQESTFVKATAKMMEQQNKMGWMMFN